MDSINPILKSLDNDRVLYFYETGYLHNYINNISFGHFACYDDIEKFEEFESEMDKNSTNILLYHGPIIGSTTDVNYKFTRGINQDLFKNWNFVMLGDIHKLQYLDVKRTIAYPGSLIQQNFGESIDKGFVLWEIEDKDNYDSNFIKVENDDIFLTLNSNELDKLENYKDKNVKLRIISSNSGEEFREKINYDNVTLKSVQVKDERKNNQVNFSNNIYDYIKQYCSEFDESTTKYILNKYESIIKENNLESGLESNIINIESIEFENMFLFKGKNYIDLRTMNGLLGIFGQNYSGKSSLIDVILFAIHGSISKSISKNASIINEESDFCSTKIILNLNKSQRFCIERSIKKDKNDKATNQLDFYEINDSNDIIQNLNEDGKTETEHKITKYFNDINNSIFTSFFIQGKFDNLIDMTDSKFKKMIYRFLDLENFEKIYVLANDEYKIINKLISNINVKSLLESIAQKEQTILELRVSRADIEKNILKNKLLMDELEAKIDSLKSKIFNIEKFDYNYDELCDKISLCNSTIVDLNNKNSEIEEKIKLEKEKICLINEFLENKTPQIHDNIDSVVKLIQELELSNQDNKDKISKNNGNIEANEKLWKFLEKNKCENENCYFISRINNYINNKGVITQENEEFNKIISSNNVQINESNSLIKSLNALVDKNKNDLATCNTNINNLEKNISKNELSIKDCESNRNDLINKKENYEKLQTQIKSNELINKEILSFQSTLAEYKNRDVSLNSSLNSKTMEIKTIEFNIENIKKSIDEYEISIIEKNNLEKFIKIFHYDGLPFDLLLQYISLINSTINETISDNFDFNIILECVDDEKKNISMFLMEGDKKMEIELCSGMQKFIASIALKISLLRINKINKFSSIFIDEGFGSLDSNSMKNITTFFDNIRQYFDSIYLITHVDYIKDIVDKYIYVNRNGTSSTIEVYKN